MNNLRFLPGKIHGLLDYAVALTLVIFPFILDFRDTSQFAHWLSVAAGIGLFAYSLATDYAVGVVAAISVRQHLVLDFAAGSLFALLAFVGGFETATAVFYGVIGFAVIAVVAVTELEPSPQPALALS